MVVVFDKNEMAMAVLNGIPDSFHSLVSALVAGEITGTGCTMEVFRNRLLQVDQRIKDREPYNSIQIPFHDKDVINSSPVAHGRPSSSPSRRPSSNMCSSCNWPGHQFHRCFKTFRTLSQKSTIIAWCRSLILPPSLPAMMILVLHTIPRSITCACFEMRRRAPLRLTHMRGYSIRDVPAIFCQYHLPSRTTLPSRALSPWFIGYRYGNRYQVRFNTYCD